MKTRYACSWVVVLVALGNAPSPAHAIDYTFDPEGSVGDWTNQQTWDPDGRPAAGDSATIPAGITCIHADPDYRLAFADWIVVEEGASLVIGTEDFTQGMAYRLDLEGNAQGTQSVVDGLLLFRHPDSQLAWKPHLRFRDVTIAGSGVISTRDGENAASAMISATRYYDEEYTLTIGPQLTVTGHYKFTGNFAIEGTLRLDHEDDRMTLGETSTARVKTISGEGLIDIRAGLFKLNSVEFDGALVWDLSGGDLEVNEVFCHCTSLSGPFTIRGGTLTVQNDFCTTGTLEYTAGTILVDDGFLAMFAEQCP